MFAIVEDNLVLAETPGEDGLHVLDRLPLQRWPRNMHVDGDSLVVVADTDVLVFDVANQLLELTSELPLDRGVYAASQLQGGVLYVATASVLGDSATLHRIRLGSPPAVAETLTIPQLVEPAPELPYPQPWLITDGAIFAGEWEMQGEIHRFSLAAGGFEAAPPIERKSWFHDLTPDGDRLLTLEMSEAWPDPVYNHPAPLSYELTSWRPTDNNLWKREAVVVDTL